MQILENFHFKELFEALPDGVVIIDAQTQLPIAYNLAAYEKLEYEKSEFAKLKISDYELLESQEEIQKHVENISKNGRDDFETKHITKHGKLLDIRVTVIAHKIKSKIYLLCTFRDITEQKRVEAISKKRQEQFRIIFEKANCGIAYGDKDGNLILCNDYFANMIQYSHDELSRMNFSQFTHPDDLAIELPLFKEIVNQERDDYRLKKRYICKNSKIIWVDLAVNVIRNEYGKPVNYLGAVIDVTKEKFLEEEIAQKEKRFRDVAEASGEYIWEMDTNGIYTFLTKPFEDMLGYTVKEGLGKTPFSFMPRDEEARVSQYFLNEIASKGVSFRGLTHKSLTKDGQIVWQKVNGLPMLDKDGDIVGYRGAALDITSEKKAQEELENAIIKAEAANSAKTQFLANMSHEIRTPMNAVIGLGDVLADMVDEPKQKDILNKINSSSKMLLGIINDILDYSKIEAGKLELEYDKFHLDEVFSQLKIMFENKASQKGIELYFNPVGEDVGLLLGDKLRLTQVLTNLLSNAVKFTEKGNITLSIELLEKSEDKKVAFLFSIEDSGIGISKEHLSKLFKPFSQADSSTTRKYGGTGLGLVISRNIIRAMGSDIYIQSEVGVGSKFSFTLEFNLASCSIKTTTQDPIKTKVLIIDDQEISRQILKNILQRYNCTFDEAANGAEAIELIKNSDTNKPYDILLIDWNMPLLNGAQTIEKLQQMYSNKELKNKIPTIFMVSGHSKHEIDLENIQIDRFISKPVTPKLLFEAITDTKSHKTKKLLELPPQSDFDLNGLNILIVEDNEINQEVISLMLKTAGADYKITNNGKEGVEVFLKNQGKFDLILMDLQMPIMSGFEATAQIREYDNEIPIIALTAAAMDDDKERVLREGMNEHIAKPIDKKRLYKVILNLTHRNLTHKNKELSKPKTQKILDLEYLINTIGSKEKASSLLGKLKNQLTNGEFKNIIQELKSNSPKSAQAIHSLKGVCGNIGAFELYEILVSMDAKNKKNKPLKPKDIERLEIAIKNLLNELNSHATQATRPNQTKKLSNKKLSKLLEKVKSFLKAGEIMDEEIILTLFENLSAKIDDDELNRWKYLVEDYEFDEALEIMENWKLN